MVMSCCHFAILQIMDPKTHEQYKAHYKVYHDKFAKLEKKLASIQVKVPVL